MPECELLFYQFQKKAMSQNDITTIETDDAFFKYIILKF
jgi:hypothetical protein